MPKKKQNNNYNQYEDYEEVRGKGPRKEKRRVRRHNEKKWLDEVARGNLDSETYVDHFEE
jgi:hypothetical protein